MATDIEPVSVQQRDAAVRIRGLTRRFDDRVVLHDLDLDIAEGEFVALLGRSGCGKSTLLRAMARLDSAVEGSGHIQAPSPSAVLFQDSRLLPWMSVLDNVRLGTPAQRDADRARRLLADVGLAGKEDAWPKTLSGGEQQRVSLARALMREPRLIAADEPFSALDALTRMRMQALLLEVYERHSPAVLFVTHDVDEALTLATRLIVLDQGHVRFDRPLGGNGLHARGSATYEALRNDILSLLGVAQPARHDGAY